MTRHLQPKSRTPVRSSNIAAKGYYQADCVLEIEFTNWSIYHYYDVPLSEYLGIINAPSHGKYLHRHIIGAYKYTRVRDADRQREGRRESPTFTIHACKWCYETLGVPVDADIDDIRQAYIRKAKECHPDRGGDVEEMKKVNEAYDLIKQDRESMKI